MIYKGKICSENICNGITKRLMYMSLVGLLGLGLMAGCGARDGDSAASPTESSGDASEPLLNSEELASEESASKEAVSEEPVSEEFDYEEWQRQREAKALAWYETLTEEDYATAKSTEELTPDDWQARQLLVLLGDLPEAETKIYGGMGDGDLLILEHQGQRRAFYKVFLTPRSVWPEFCVYDYDGDQTAEIGMICYVISGTGVAIRDFSIFDSVEDTFDTLYTMPWEEVQQACDQVWWSYEENVLRIGVGDEYEEHSLADTHFSGTGIRDLALGDITEFSFGEPGEVFCDVALALALEEQATPLFLEEMGTLYDNGVSWDIDDVHFQVHYDGAGGFWTDGIGLR